MGINWQHLQNNCTIHAKAEPPEEKKVGMYRETLQAGEAFINFSAGGAGWGDPANRDPDAIAEDIQDGLTTNCISKMKEK